MASKHGLQTTAMGIFVIGLVTFVSSTIVTDGFVHGLFQGMTIALMIGAAFLFGAQWTHDRRRDGADRDSEAMWLPSRDDDRE